MPNARQELSINNIPFDKKPFYAENGKKVTEMKIFRIKDYKQWSLRIRAHCILFNIKWTDGAIVEKNRYSKDGKESSVDGKESLKLWRLFEKIKWKIEYLLKW